MLILNCKGFCWFILSEFCIVSWYVANRDVWNNNFISVWFGFEKTRIQFGMSLIRFGLKKLFGSDVVAIYYLCNTWVVNLQQILQHYCDVLNDFDTVWCHSQQRQQVNNVIVFKIYMLNRFRSCFKSSLSARWIQVKLFLSLFNLNCRLHAVSVRKPSARMSNFLTVRIFYIRLRTKFRFSAHP